MSLAPLTKAEEAKGAQLFASLGPFLDRVDYLKSRWADEEGYEAFDEYREAAEKALPAGAAKFTMTEAFLITFVLDGWAFKVTTKAETLQVEYRPLAAPAQKKGGSKAKG